MKNVLLSTLVIILFTTAVQAQEYSEDEINYHLNRYSKMKKTGFTMAGIGAAMLVGGIALMSSADWDKEESAGQVNYTTEDSNGGVGMLMAIPGAGLTIAGLIVGGIGSKKYSNFKKLVEKSNLGFNLNKNYQGLRFSFMF